MIKWGIRVLLTHYLEQGLSKSAIARQLGIDRRTINPPSSLPCGCSKRSAQPPTRAA